MVELALAMLDAGGDPRPKDRFGNTPLWSAVVNAKRNLGLVDMLMRHGADPHGKNKAGRSPLDFARQIGSEPVIALLSIPAADPPRPESIGAAARPASASAASKSGQEEFDRLWDELVPSSGQADTVQGELVRAIGRLSDEAYRNGNGNRDEGYRLLAEYLRQHLCGTTVFSADECQEINRRIDRMLDYEVPDIDGPASPYAYLTERVVRWCAARQSPLPNSKNPLLHRQRQHVRE
jgi:ankyrin repeat protein